MAAVHQVSEQNERRVPGCHSGKEIDSVDGIEGVHPVV
jgi:hypothetical protein